MAKRSSGSSSFTLAKFSFWLIIIIGIAVCVAAILKYVGVGATIQNVCDWIQRICFYLSLFVPALLSYDEARRRSGAWFVIWLIFVIVIIASVVLLIVKSI